jgi:hypothetical protein
MNNRAKKFIIVDYTVIDDNSLQMTCCQCSHTYAINLDEQVFECHLVCEHYFAFTKSTHGTALYPYTCNFGMNPYNCVDRKGPCP